MTDSNTQAFLDAAPRNRESQYQEQFAAIDVASTVGDTASEEQAETDLDQSILAVDKGRGFDVTISTGGPGEWLTCTVDSDGEVDHVEFCVAWWSPVQRSTVNEGDALWRLAERMNPWEGQVMET